MTGLNPLSGLRTEADSSQEMVHTVTILLLLPLLREGKSDKPYRRSLADEGASRLSSAYLFI